MLFALPILASLNGLKAVSAQSSSISFVETTRELWPTGASEGSRQTESTLPLACYQGCFPVTSPYFGCFINTTLSVSGNRTLDQELCDDFFCSQGNYTQLLDCANCIIANGGERPLGYHTNTALTAAPSQTDSPLGIPVNPLGLVDREQVNGWLANVTERCSTIDRAVTGDITVTASPTTTGPYYTSFGSGETISYATWTGLTQYRPPVVTLKAPADEGIPAGGSSASDSSRGSDSGNGSPTSSAAASESSPANHAISGKEGSAGLTVLGMMVGYVVVVFQ